MASKPSVYTSTEISMSSIINSMYHRKMTETYNKPITLALQSRYISGLHLFCIMDVTFL